MKSYKRPSFLFNAHLETIFPTLSRRVRVSQSPERLELEDGDFLDLYWSKQGSERLVVVLHGLEGDAHRVYIQGMIRACMQAGFDCLTFNYRGCGEEVNRLKRFYHSGATDDVRRVMDHVGKRDYKSISMVGFSLGGNLILKYLGEGAVLPNLSAAVAVSVPLDLLGCTLEIHKRRNFIYHDRFLRSLKEKVRRKSAHGFDFDLDLLEKIDRLWDFDDHFTAPLGGFAGAEDYYISCSSKNFISEIKIPTLILNAANDPFLSETCYAPHVSTENEMIKFMQPEHGGHVGFFQKGGLYFSEWAAVSFLNSNI
ncbi:YheT family hydrolase [Persicobacter diffluens]|uniref:Alpha/beta hydrolase n=1 Tax=Persicobacter diffluens TaxID=981 RepID=A0AAN4VXD1_9BACT|nr:alpha/beta hydrolase [Persicobacter diffluens]